MLQVKKFLDVGCIEVTDSDIRAIGLMVQGNAKAIKLEISDTVYCYKAECA